MNSPLDASSPHSSHGMDGTGAILKPQTFPSSRCRLAVIQQTCGWGPPSSSHHHQHLRGTFAATRVPTQMPTTMGHTKHHKKEASRDGAGHCDGSETRTEAAYSDGIATKPRCDGLGAAGKVYPQRMVAITAFRRAPLSSPRPMRPIKTYCREHCPAPCMGWLPTGGLGVSRCLSTGL